VTRAPLTNAAASSLQISAADGLKQTESLFAADRDHFFNAIGQKLTLNAP
jgi:hypothetical protein